MKVSLKEPEELVFNSVKAFITKRHPKGDITFLVKCKKILSYDANGLNTFELILEPVITDTPQEIREVIGSKQDKWELTIKKGLLDSKPKASFSYLEVDSSLYSCGIGSVMFNILIKEGWSYFSDAEAKLLLTEGPDKENALRKEKLYEKFGLTIDYDDSRRFHGHAKILSFDELDVYTEFKNIESLDIADKFLSKLNQINELSYENGNLKHSKKSLLAAYWECDDKYTICSDRLLKFIIAMIVIVGLCGYILKL